MERQIFLYIKTPCCISFSYDSLEVCTADDVKNKRDEKQDDLDEVSEDRGCFEVDHCCVWWWWWYIVAIHLSCVFINFPQVLSFFMLFSLRFLLTKVSFILCNMNAKLFINRFKNCLNKTEHINCLK